MKLTKATIKNYRSISYCELDFSHGCQILVGINESGKSNILRALQFIDPEIELNPNDLRIERKDESPVNEGLVRFHFELDDLEIERIHNSLTSKTNKDSALLPVILHKEKSLTLLDFCKLRCNGLYEINFKTGKRRYTYWSLPQKDFSIVDGWKKSKVDAELALVNNSGIKSKIDTNQYFQSSIFNLVEQLMTESITVEEISDFIGKQVAIIIENNLPKCVYWRYSDQYLLPSSIAVSTFTQNPDSCIPLKSMFELAGYKGEQIADAINSTRQGQSHRYIHLLERVSDAATKHLHSVWKDHKSVSIEIRANGDELLPIIKDEQIHLDMANRSDGFKRLASFILQISAKVKTAELKDSVILIDEPEIALHPKGAKSLMKELVDVGKSNIVVYSTHSIFMIDRDCIPRHLIVEKKNDITTLRKAEKSKIQDEDVLYSAIGYSLFETLRKRNVIFEGWRDKELFRVTQEAMSKQDKDLKNSFDEYGLTFAEGVKDIRNVVKFLELANRPTLIVTDNDSAGLNGQREHQRTKSWGTWKLLSEILENNSLVSSEDLLTSASIVKKANLYRKVYPLLPELKIEEFVSGNSSIKILDAWLKSLQLEPEQHKDAMHELKNRLFEKLRREDVKDDAERLVRFVLNFDFSSSTQPA
jgi:hypothetical protein